MGFSAIKPTTMRKEEDDREKEEGGKSIPPAACHTLLLDFENRSPRILAFLTGGEEQQPPDLVSSEMDVDDFPDSWRPQPTDQRQPAAEKRRFPTPSEKSRNFGTSTNF